MTKEPIVFISNGAQEVKLSSSLNTVLIEFAPQLEGEAPVRVALPAETLPTLRSALQQMESALEQAIATRKH